MNVAQMITDRKPQAAWKSQRWFQESMIRAVGPDQWEDFRDGKIRHTYFANCHHTRQLHPPERGAVSAGRQERSRDQGAGQEPAPRRPT